MEQVRGALLIFSAIVLAALMLATLVRAILGPRFTDRIIAVNVINTLVVEANIPVNRMSALLFELEMKGVVKALVGGVYHLLA